MAPYEEELLTKYLIHLNILGEDGDFEEWYQLVRCADGPGPREPWRKRRNSATGMSWRPTGSFNRLQDKRTAVCRRSGLPQLTLEDSHAGRGSHLNAARLNRRRRLSIGSPGVSA